MEQLLRPLTEAALSLEAQAQSLFLSLSATIFFLEYRRIILSNKHTYRYYYHAANGALRSSI